MKRSLLICAAALMMLVNVPQANADTIQLTLDLRNTNRANAASGGTWQLFARVNDNGQAPDGVNGISGIRAILNNVTEAGITFATGINQLGPDTYTNTLSNGAVEIVYGQDISAAGVVTGVGIGANANVERLIASGSWPAGPRPTFGTDPGAFGSEGNFLGGAAAPFPASLEVSGANITTQVVTLGDFNNSGTITSADTGQYVAVLTGGLPFNPAGDFNQSGTVTSADTGQYVATLTGPGVAAISAVPEPSSIGLALLASMGLIARRRRV